MKERLFESKRVTFSIGIAITVFIVYNTALFCIAGFSNHTATFWVSYFFQIISFLAVILAFALLENTKLRLHDWLFRMPLIKHSMIYAVSELILSVVLMILSHTVSWGVALAIQIILLGIYAIFAQSCLIAKEIVTEVNHDVKVQSTYIKLLRLDAEMVVRNTEDSGVKQAFTKLAEQIRYSDPIGCDAVKDLESELSVCIKSALAAAKNNDSEQCMTHYKQAVLLLEERNEKCKIFK